MPACSCGPAGSSAEPERSVHVGRAQDGAGRRRAGRPQARILPHAHGDAEGSRAQKARREAAAPDGLAHVVSQHEVRAAEEYEELRQLTRGPPVRQLPAREETGRLQERGRRESGAEQHRQQRERVMAQAAQQTAIRRVQRQPQHESAGEEDVAHADSDRRYDARQSAAGPQCARQRVRPLAHSHLRGMNEERREDDEREHFAHEGQGAARPLRRWRCIIAVLAGHESPTGGPRESAFQRSRSTSSPRSRCILSMRRTTLSCGPASAALQAMFTAVGPTASVQINSSSRRMYA